MSLLPPLLEPIRMLGVDAPWRQGPGDHGSDLFNAAGSLGIGILRRETAQMRRGHC
ncbi:MAG: hypothetical protein HOI41_18325, partial [Acidimicrobiaceae bacterium]|nr:hypothetical protein [Acidimicrobiaceae bacterium]